MARSKADAKKQPYENPSLKREFVTITHKGLGESEVTKRAFEKVWSKRGWTLVEDKKQESNSPQVNDKKES